VICTEYFRLAQLANLRSGMASFRCGNNRHGGGPQKSLLERGSSTLAAKAAGACRAVLLSLLSITFYAFCRHEYKPQHPTGKRKYATSHEHRRVCWTCSGLTGTCCS